VEYTHDTRIHGRHGLHIRHIVVNLKSLILALFLGSSSAFAGYAQLVPPVGWSQGGSAASTFNFSRVAANDATFLLNTVRTNAALNVGGRAVSVPVAMRLAANAPQIAATVAYLNPALLLIGTAAAAYAFYKLNEHEILDGRWVKVNRSGDYEYSVSGTVWSGSVEGACGQYVAAYNALQNGETASASASGQSCSGKFVGPWGVNYFNVSVQKRAGLPKLNYEPVTQVEFERKFSPIPLPDTFPPAFPEPLPVESPVINPTPGANPTPQPLRVPQGEPQPVPNSDPRQWRSPVVDIVPAPTPSSPWQVDVQPKDVTKLEPTPLPETAPVPLTPTPDITETPKEDKTDLCRDNPDILACQKPEFDTPKEDDLKTKKIDIEVSPAGGFGSTGGSCPHGKTLKAGGIEISYQPVCDFMTGIRPVVLALAWLSAGLILLGLRGPTS